MSTTHAQGTSDAFFRHIVSGMRNGVLAITRDGRLALINDEAYRIFGVTSRPEDLGRPIGLVLKDHPDVVRVLTGAFDLHLLPNRVEMRLKPSNRVIGYTVTFVPDDTGRVVGAAMFFKDLTRVEQLEERERLRDRLAAVGEMAAVIAHEVKNPLAGIEVMAGAGSALQPGAPAIEGLAPLLSRSGGGSAFALYSVSCLGLNWWLYARRGAERPC